MGSCAAPSAKGDDKFITTDYLQQCPSGSLSAHCIAMHESEWRSVWGLTAFIPSVFDSFSPGS
ncbi:hypothetical protein FPL16_01445 [Salmonella enterica subsp. enterica serovar Typhimurium]|nr:hypothetical protein FPL16_01445 [Salmonella enterica subsp. enterica serovar Typhimurium]